MSYETRQSREAKCAPVRALVKDLNIGDEVKVRRKDFEDVARYRSYVYHVGAYESKTYSTRFNRVTDVITIMRVR